jgi:hypothetical protein
MADHIETGRVEIALERAAGGSTAVSHDDNSGQERLANYLPAGDSATGTRGGKLLNRRESFGARDRDRTCDPYHVKVVLYR